MKSSQSGNSIPSAISSFATSGYGSESNGVSKPTPSNTGDFSLNETYDILMIYDPSDHFYLEELWTLLEPRGLQIFDLARDRPPGVPQIQCFKSALGRSTYTCIVVTRNFISNFWLQFKSDMAIQDMLDNYEKMYSVVVVVMDRAIQPKNLPLDLITLSPIFRAERYFEHRLTLAFQAKPSLNNLQWMNPNNTAKNSAAASSSALENCKVNESSGISRQPQEHDQDATTPCDKNRRPSYTVVSTGCRSPKECEECLTPSSIRLSHVQPFSHSDYGSAPCLSNGTRNSEFNDMNSLGNTNSVSSDFIASLQISTSSDDNVTSSYETTQQSLKDEYECKHEGKEMTNTFGCKRNYSLKSLTSKIQNKFRWPKR